MEKIFTFIPFKKIFSSSVLLAFVVSSVALSGGISTKVANAATNWDVSGNHILTMTYQGTDYDHAVTFIQDEMDNLTGNGSHNDYSWVITDGEIVNNTMSLTAYYTTTPDAVDPQTILEIDGVIQEDGSITGTWSDNYSGGSRAGEVYTDAGVAESLAGEINAEDFGVVDYDTGNGQLVGYSAGFALTDATFLNAQSVVVELFAHDNQLLQTNTLVGVVPGNQISSPFDVSGDFDYEADGYWTNVRENQYGQSLAAYRALATVTLANGKTVRAEHTDLTGNPSDVYSDNGDITTNNATQVTQSNAILNGTNGDTDATGHSFWASLNSFSTESTTVPDDVYSTSNLGAVDANTSFSAYLTSTGIAVTPSTMYYFAAWSEVDGTWYPGEVLNFTTGLVDGDLEGEVVGENGDLEVTSIEMTDSTGTANNSFEDGWEYVFNITVPSDETDVSMKFDNWMSANGANTLAAANNMRISSAQANNGGATVLITGADTYSTPALTMVTDLNPALDGMQVEIVVEVKIPSGTNNGSYTTSYGVKSQ